MRTIRIVSQCEIGAVDRVAIAVASELVHGGDSIKLEVRRSGLVPSGVAYVIDPSRIRDVPPPELTTAA
jgi:hypothetical protein